MDIMIEIFMITGCSRVYDRHARETASTNRIREDGAAKSETIFVFLMAQRFFRMNR